MWITSVDTQDSTLQTFFFDNNVCEYKFQNLRQVCIYAFFIFVYIPKMYAYVQLI